MKYLPLIAALIAMAACAPQPEWTTATPTTMDAQMTDNCKRVMVDDNLWMVCR